ncbi:MAG: carboxylesterase/lipase family protein [Lachnospiraceae bacterium]
MADSSNNNEQDPTVVSVTGGTIQGEVSDGVYRFLGVPYAEARELFMPAEEVSAWDGIRDASEYGPVSYQSPLAGNSGTDSADYSNNCQNLNIWTPGTDGEKRPVMVWIHGGGLAFGSANETAYDGANLSRNQNVVVVGVNHRLGVYGFLDLSFADEKYKESDNLCILDIIDALEWIQENIEKFGGDPDNVTLFGQSGGGVKIIALMSSPYAKGLFQRAVIESGATDRQGVTFTRKEVSLALGREILKNLDIPENHPEQLQQVSNSDLQNAASLAVQTIGEEYQIPQSIGTGFSYEWAPVVDGNIIPEDPVTDNGFTEAAKDCTIMIGSNLNEWNLYFPDLLKQNVTDEVREAYLSAYPNEDPDGASNVDTLLRLPVLNVTAHKADQYTSGGAPVYSYIYTKQEPAYGAYHGAELPYVFGNGSGASDQDWTKVIQSIWASFARTGVPTVPGADTWEPYTRENGAVMIIDDESYLAYHHDEKLLSLLAPDYEW